MNPKSSHHSSTENEGFHERVTSGDNRPVFCRKHNNFRPDTYYSAGQSLDALSRSLHTVGSSTESTTSGGTQSGGTAGALNNNKNADYSPIYNKGSSEGTPGKKSKCDYRIEGRPDLAKTKLCDLYMKKQCLDPSCRWAHGRIELKATADYYKTALCKYWLESVCYAGPHCRHAHGEHEIRSRLSHDEEEQSRPSHDEQLDFRVTTKNSCPRARRVPKRCCYNPATERVTYINEPPPLIDYGNNRRGLPTPQPHRDQWSSTAYRSTRCCQRCAERLAQIAALASRLGTERHHCHRCCIRHRINPPRVNNNNNNNCLLEQQYQPTRNEVAAVLGIFELFNRESQNNTNSQTSTFALIEALHHYAELAGVTAGEGEGSSSSSSSSGTVISPVTRALKIFIDTIRTLKLPGDACSAVKVLGQTPAFRNLAYVTVCRHRAPQQQHCCSPRTMTIPRQNQSSSSSSGSAGPSGGRPSIALSPGSGESTTSTETRGRRKQNTQYAGTLLSLPTDALLQMLTHIYNSE